jgi:hypothetical protein
LAALPELYARAEVDIGRSLDGELTTEQLITRWLGGMQGPVYAVGADMMRMIDAHLGQDEAVNLARDCRQLLVIYNRAARVAQQSGEQAFVFAEALATRLQEHSSRDTAEALSSPG